MDITKINKRKLGEIRQRLGAENEYDQSYDDRISRMSPKEIVAKWCGWVLGDEDWGNEIVTFYEDLKSIE